MPVTGGLVRGIKRVTSDITITGVLDGTTEVLTTFTIDHPMEAGSILIVIDGDQSAAVITFLIYDSGRGVRVADTGAHAVNTTVTIDAGGEGARWAVMSEEFGVGTNFVLAAGTYTLRAISNDALSTGTFVASIALIH